MATIHNSLEALKAHLQLQLRHKSAECERLTAQLRKAEGKRSHEADDLATKLEAANSTIETLRQEREVIKRAAKGQKRRAERAEARLRELEDEIGDSRDRLPTVEESVAENDELARLRERLEEMDRKTRDTEAMVRDKLNASDGGGGSQGDNDAVVVVEKLEQVSHRGRCPF